MEEQEWQVNELPGWTWIHTATLVIGGLALFTILWYLTALPVALLSLSLLFVLVAATSGLGYRRQPIRVALSREGIHIQDRRGETRFFSWSSVESFRERTPRLGNHVYELVAKKEGRTVYVPLMPNVGEQVSRFIANQA